MKIEKGPLKGREFEMAEKHRVDRFPDQIDKILEVVGHPDAFVSDESQFNDFALDFSNGMTPEEEAELSAKLGVKVTGESYIVDVAETMKGVS